MNYQSLVSDLEGDLSRYTILTHLYMLNQNRYDTYYISQFIYTVKSALFPRSILLNLLQSVNETQAILAIDSRYLPTKCPFTVLSLCKNRKGNIV